MRCATRPHRAKAFHEFLRNRISVSLSVKIPVATLVGKFDSKNKIMDNFS